MNSQSILSSKAEAAKKTYRQGIISAGAVLDGVGQLSLDHRHICRGEGQELEVHIGLVGGSSHQEPAGGLPKLCHLCNLLLQENELINKDAVFVTESVS